ncbi:Polyamine transporter 4 [Golovinomyces cichoracearum]|uniref:Polyamine transporter 4 n=1 Tax=Golovinomyces cichoracearum TaxID=62708 RepID=A0A420IYI7_9PEZI|nr:Polyamine transporter 4 [Golovinomyces cichoracearum]
MNTSFLIETDTEDDESVSMRRLYHNRELSNRTRNEEPISLPHRHNSIMTLKNRSERVEKMQSAILSSSGPDHDAIADKNPEDQSTNSDNDNSACRTASRSSTIKDVSCEENDDTSSCVMHSLTNVTSALSSINNDWDSATNFENPRNWPMWKRIFHTAIPALYGFVLTIGTSAYVPAIPFIMLRFKVSREVALLPLAFYTFGFTLGPLIYAPLSELYGRRIVYWISMPLLIIFTSICGASNNIAFLIIMRFLASLTGSGALAVGAGTILDLWRHEAQGIAALAFIMAPFLGPCLGPLIGAYVMSLRNYDWRWSIWIVLLIAAPVAGMSLFLDETSKSRILYKKASRTLEGKEPHKKGDTRLFLRKLRQALSRPCHMMLFEPLVALLSIYTAFAFAMLFSFFASYNFVFISVYHFNMIKVGTTFLGILVGFVFALISFAIFDITIYRKESIRCHGEPAPEHRLYNAMLGSLLLPIGLFWFAWTPSVNNHWILPVLAGVPFGWGTLGIFISSTAYLVDVYQVNSSSAIAANGILRYSLGGAFPLFTLQIYTGLGIHWAGSLFAFLSVILTPVPWIFFWKGRLLRAKSRYDTSSA